MAGKNDNPLFFASHYPRNQSTIGANHLTQRVSYELSTQPVDKSVHKACNNNPKRDSHRIFSHSFKS